MLSRRAKLRQEIPDKVRWIASQSPLYEFLRNDVEGIYWSSLRLSESCDGEVNAAFRKIAELQIELKCLRFEIPPVEEYLDWYAYKSCNRAH
jgi:hypothetical protein